MQRISYSEFLQLEDKVVMFERKDADYLLRIFLNVPPGPGYYEIIREANDSHKPIMLWRICKKTDLDHSYDVTLTLLDDEDDRAKAVRAAVARRALEGSDHVAD